jgi:hypothetical protein
MQYWFLTDSKTGGNAILWGTVKDVLQDNIEIVDNANRSYDDQTKRTNATFKDMNIITFEDGQEYIISVKEKTSSDSDLITFKDEKCTANIDKDSIVTLTTSTGIEIKYHTATKENSTALEGIFNISYEGQPKNQTIINIYKEGITVEKNTVPTFFKGELSASIDATTN